LLQLKSLQSFKSGILTLKISRRRLELEVKFTVWDRKVVKPWVTAVTCRKTPIVKEEGEVQSLT